MSAQTPGGRRRKHGLPTWIVAMIVFGVVLGSLVAAIFKPQLSTLAQQLTGDETRTIAFSGNHFLLEDASKVKVAGVPVGVVASADPGPNGGAIVTVVVDSAVVEAVGDHPSARLRANTLLGGLYNIELVPGGDRSATWEEQIPVERTRLPTEVDDLAEAMQPDALKGSRAGITQFEATLAQGGTQALKALLADAPATFRPGSEVLGAFRGQRPQTDLPELVRNLQASSGVLTRQDGQLDAIVASLRDTSKILSDTGGSVATAIDRLPKVLDTADSGLRRLNGSLDKLEATADPARATVRELENLLDRAAPVVADARPVVHDLRHAMEDTRPLLEGLTPFSKDLESVLDHLHGPVLDRLNGPIKNDFYAPYKGVGPYRDTKGDNPFFKELGYMFAGLNWAGAYVDPNGHAVGVQETMGFGALSPFAGLSPEKHLQPLANQLGGNLPAAPKPPAIPGLGGLPGDGKAGR